MPSLTNSLNLFDYFIAISHAAGDQDLLNLRANRSSTIDGITLSMENEPYIVLNHDNKTYTLDPAKKHHSKVTDGTLTSTLSTFGDDQYEEIVAISDKLFDGLRTRFSDEVINKRLNVSIRLLSTETAIRNLADLPSLQEKKCSTFMASIEQNLGLGRNRTRNIPAATRTENLIEPFPASFISSMALVMGENFLRNRNTTAAPNVRNSEWGRLRQEYGSALPDIQETRTTFARGSEENREIPSATIRPIRFQSLETVTPVQAESQISSLLITALQQQAAERAASQPLAPPPYSQPPVVPQTPAVAAPLPSYVEPPLPAYTDLFSTDAVRRAAARNAGVPVTPAASARRNDPLGSNEPAPSNSTATREGHSALFGRNSRDSDQHQ